jgi:ubiquinone/menaquinone biosynthesis C-methylase UbiE
MADSNQDLWVDWLSDYRFPGGEEESRIRNMLDRKRDKLIQNADISPGDTVLDVGCGDGFIGIKATKETGSEGKVLFLDSSPDVLDQARSNVQETDPAAATEFKVDSAIDLESIATDTIDVILARSVLLFVSSPSTVFDQFHRVLKPEGRFSINESIRKFIHEMNQHQNTILGYNLAEYEKEVPDRVIELTDKFWQYIENNRTEIGTTLFSELDLFKMAENAGFNSISLDFHVRTDSNRRAAQWDEWLSSSFGPGRPTNREVLENAFTEHEKEQFRQFVRPLIETNVSKVNRKASAYLYGVR